MDASAPPVAATDSSRAIPQIRAVLVCDLADSTALVERIGDSAAAELMRRHDRLARDLLHVQGGREIDKTDGFLILFDRPLQAVAFALAYQRMLRELGEEEHHALAARIGIHVGEVVLWDNDAADIADGAKPVEVEGLAKPMAARLMSLARPGQTLLTETARSLAQRAQAELSTKERVRWVAHGRYRFKGVPVPMEVHEVGEEGLAPLTPPPTSSKAQREVPWWKQPAALVIEALLLLAVIALPLWLSLRAPPAIAFAERDWVVLGDLRNLTSEKLFDDALDEAFRIGLEQSRYVNVVPALRAREALKRMQLEPGVALDREVAVELALREGARAVILPTVAEVGGRVRISAEVIDPNTGATVFADSADGEGSEAVLPAMDAVLAGLRERLGESLQAIELASAPLARITTTSLDALRTYALAEQSIAEGNVRAAISLLEQAISLDPEFAMAHGRLATIRHSMGDPVGAFESAQRALAKPDKLSARERMLLEATTAFFATPGDALEKWTALLRVYPDVAVADNNAGLALLWFHNDPVRAAPHFRAFVESESKHHLRVFGWFGLAVAQVGMGDFEQARESMRQGEAFGLMPPSFENTFAPLAERDHAAARTAISRPGPSWGASTPLERALRIAAIELDSGDPASALETIGEALDSADPSAPLAVRGRLELGASLLALELGSSEAGSRIEHFIEREIRRLDQAVSHYDHATPVHVLLAALLAERAGLQPLASTTLARVRSAIAGRALLHVERLMHTIECVTSIESDAAAEVACLEGQIDGFEFYLTHALLMDRLAGRGELAGARREATWLATHRGRALVEMQKYETQLINLAAANDAELRLIEWSDTASDRHAASVRVRALRRAWSGAPDDSPFVRRLDGIENADSDEQDH